MAASEKRGGKTNAKSGIFSPGKGPLWLADKAGRHKRLPVVGVGAEGMSYVVGNDLNAAMIQYAASFFAREPIGE